jgi:hypothetical protein
MMAGPGAVTSAAPQRREQAAARAQISVVLVTEAYATIATTVDHLLAQTAADRLELVIVAPDVETLGLDPRAKAGLHSVQVVERAPFPLADARAEAIRAATADVVAFGETHSFPAPGWAEALISAHRGPWAGVGPAIEIANPRSALSHASMLMEFVRWMAPVRAGEADTLPPHNSSFKREVLVAYRDELPAMLEEDLLLTEDLRRRGHRMRMEPAARTSHVMVSRFPSFLRDRYRAGRNFAVTRARRWPAWRRAVYALGLPLIPLARLRHIVGALRRVEEPQLRRPSTLGWLGIGLPLAALGEAIGYARGGTRSPGDWDVEIYRVEHHVNARDRRLLETG